MRREQLGFFWIIVVGLGVGLRVWVAWHVPFTNDEGAYLYDGWMVAQGRLPVGDVMVKSPVLAAFFGGSVKILGNWLWAGRVVAVVASFVVGVVLVLVGRRLWGRGVAEVLGVVWFLGGASVLLGVYGHTEVMAMVWTSAGWGLAIVVLEQWTSISNRTRWVGAVVSGVCLGLALATRKTAVVPIMVVGLWCLGHYGRGVVSSRWIGQWLMGFLGVVGAWLGLSYWWYGWLGVGQALGVGYGQVLARLDQYDWSFYWQVRSRWVVDVLSGMWAAELVLFIVGLLGWIYLRKRLEGGLVVWGVVMWGGLLVALYMKWPVFLPQYSVDFLVPVVVLIGAVVGRSLIGKWRVVALIGFLAVSLLSMGRWGREGLHGIYPAENVLEAADVVREVTGEEDLIVTAAVVVPYVAERHVVEDVSHPLWYRYSFIENEVRDLFLPRREVVAEVAQSATVAVIDVVTRYVYGAPGFDLINSNEEWEGLGQVGGRRGELLVWKRLQ